MRIATGPLSLVSALAMLQLGCGYKLIDYRAAPANFQSISIKTFENDSYEPGIELVVGDTLRREQSS
jgi:hypothetical protein